MPVKTTNVILTHVNPEQWINTVKVVRQLRAKHKMEAGLKESVELVNEVRDKGREVNLLTGVSQYHARTARQRLREVKAVCRLSQKLVPLEEG